MASPWTSLSASPPDRSIPLIARVLWYRWFSAKLVVVAQQTHQQLCQCTESAVFRCASFPRVGHFSDGSVSVKLVWTRIHHVIHETQKDRIVFRHREETRICVIPVKQRRLAQALSGPCAALHRPVSKSSSLTSDSEFQFLLSPFAKANTVFTSVGL